MPLLDLAPQFASWQERIARGENITASFKYEDGNAGPLWLTAVDEEAADPAVTEIRPGVFARPFGYEPTWEYRTPCWVTVAHARRIARHLGLALEES